MLINLKITRATLSDVGEVKELLIPQFEEHHIPFSAAELDNTVKELIDDKRLGFILLASEGDKRIGVAVISFAWTLEHAGKTAWLDEIFVIPGKRGQGVGKALIKQVIESAAQTGCRAIDLEVDQEHRSVEALYKREGFNQLPRTRWFKTLE